MSADRIIRRYAAFFRGWAQAFGEHEKFEGPSQDVRWLVGQDQVGLILVPAIKRLWFPRLLGHPSEDLPEVVLHSDAIQVAAVRMELGQDTGAPLAPILALVARGGDLHLYQTYHLIYPAGTRILTLSAHAPLGILYRELTPLRLRIAGNPVPTAFPACARRHRIPAQAGA
jgi:hypothetical protein